MRFFNGQFYKNLIWIYLSVLCCFSYNTMLASIPDHVYLKEGENLALDCMLPVDIAVCDGQEAMAEVAVSTYETIQNRRNRVDCEALDVGEHEIVCYLFGLLPIKEVEVSVVEGKKLYAAGRVVGIYGATQGVLVLGSSPVETADGTYLEPAEHVISAGDYIVAVDGEPVQEKEELIQMVNALGEEPLTLSLWRGEELIEVSVQAVKTKEVSGGSRYMLGLWVKDDMAGIGTLTYYNDSGSFGALGHGIGDGETGNLLRIGEGELYESEILTIVKGERGTPGELQGVVRYGQKNQIGTVTSNTDIGIYGDLDKERLEEYSKEDTYYSVGYKQDVKPQDAVILSDASGEPGVYHIVIDSLDYSPSDKNKGIRFHVDDEALLDLTGGIVQGLSGSPIIQNGQIIGAVTHVLVNDPTRGYGIFVENMLEH